MITQIGTLSFYKNRRIKMSIKTIQKSLQSENISGKIITLNNLFITEDIRDDENQIKALTGFSGSNALLFITPNKCYLFTDARYTLQAQKQVNQKQIENCRKYTDPNNQNIIVRCHCCQSQHGSENGNGNLIHKHFYNTV